MNINNHNMCHSIACIWGQGISWNDLLSRRHNASFHELKRTVKQWREKKYRGDAGKKTDSRVKRFWGKSVILYMKSLVCEVKAFLPVSARRSYYHSFYLWTKASWTAEIKITRPTGDQRYCRARRPMAQGFLWKAFFLESEGNLRERERRQREREREKLHNIPFFSMPSRYISTVEIALNFFSIVALQNDHMYNDDSFMLSTFYGFCKI